MKLKNKGTAQNVTNIKLNVCFCYKCVIAIYQFGSAPKVIKTLKFMISHPGMTQFFSPCQPIGAS